MIFRNSIKSIFRSKGKTALFTLVIFSLTLALTLAGSVWASVTQFLDDCDDYYTTVALVEFMGTKYPDDDIYDPAMVDGLKSFDISSIKNNDAVLSWETPSRTFGYVKEFWRTDNFMPDKMLSVLVIGNVSFNEEHQLFSATVYKTLYSSKIKENKYIHMDADFGPFEQGHYYLIFGEVYHGYSPILHLRPAAFENAIAEADGAEIPDKIDITSDTPDNKFYNIPEDSILIQIADTLSVTNNSVLVESTDNLMALLPFHQEELYFVEGRPFSEEEYTLGSHVAVISELMAARLGIHIGDTITLSLAISDRPGFYNTYWAGDGFTVEETFTVVGITNTLMDKSWYVYIPRAANIPASRYPIGYTAGQAVLSNDEAVKFWAQMAPQIPGRFQLKIYDQGYSSVTIPYQTILSTAIIVTAICSLLELSVILLFGFIFVFRQRDASETMLMIGAGKTRVVVYFLISAGLIALIASIAGATAGYWLHDNILTMVARTAENSTLIDNRYSNGNLTISRTLAFAPQLEMGFFFTLGAIIFLLIIITCLVFTLFTFTKRKITKRKQPKVKKKVSTSKLPGGLMKYTTLSIIRGGAKSLIVPLLAATVVLFFGHLSRTAQQYKIQLEDVYDNTQIHGYYTDINGKQVGNLVVNAYDVATLYYTGELNDLDVSRGTPYYFTGITEFADGTKQNISPIYVPSNGYQLESLIAKIQRGPDLTAANDINSSPEFYYSDDISISFLKGYDQTVLSVPENDANVFSCIIPTDLMEEHQISLGDIIRLSLEHMIRNPIDNEKIFAYYDLRVVGSYEKQGTENTIYAPLSLFFNTGLIWGEGQPAVDGKSNVINKPDFLSAKQKDSLLSNVFHSANFQLKDSHNLIKFKDFLTEYGYSQVREAGKVREFIILRDASFNNAVASIKQQNHYINILYPFLYALVGIISVTMAYLLITSRKFEFATMRGLGVPRTRTFFSFFSEQFFLCLAGTFVGATIWHLFWGVPSLAHLVLSIGFLICYFVGSAISIVIMNHADVLKILLDRE